MKRALLMMVVVLVAVAAEPLTAASFGITPSVGTLGLGVGVDARITSGVGFRVFGNTGSRSQDFHKQSIDYTGKLKLRNYGALLDLHPTGSSFRISVGALSNSNRIDLASKPGSTITVNGVQYPSEVIGTVTGDVKFNKTSAYVGIGRGRPENSRFAVVFDLGAVYQGSPKFSVQPHPTNPALVPASFYTNLEAERAKTEEDVKNYRYYPVVTLGLSFGF